jgi:hypothetical protein
MSHHRTPCHKLTARPSLIALTAILVAAALGLAACGGSSSTTTTAETTANAAATGTTTAGTSSTGTTSTATSSTTPGATTPGASTTGTSTAGASPTGTTPAAHAARFAAVRTCLSKKGITLPQRGAGGFPGGGGAQLPSGMSRTQFAEALRSCGVGFKGSNHFGRSPGGFKNPYNNPRFHPVLVRLAACLRQNGINVGEPNTSGKGPVFDTKGINTGSTKFKTAMAACRYTLLGALKSSKPQPGATG